MLKTKSPAFDRAYQEGHSARMRNKPRVQNPYTTKTGFGPTFHKYWERGWRDADKRFRG